MERYVSERRAEGPADWTVMGPAERWRALGFPSEEDMLDWMENHSSIPRAARGRRWWSLVPGLTALAISRFGNSGA